MTLPKLSKQTIQDSIQLLMQIVRKNHCNFNLKRESKVHSWWTKLVYKALVINHRQQRTKPLVTKMSIKSLWKNFVPVMMISIMSNNECRDHDANKKTNSAYKLNVSMLSEI